MFLYCPDIRYKCSHKSDINVMFVYCPDINECLSDPCQNGATCNNTPGGFTCQCVDGYTGPLCQNGKCFKFKHLCYDLLLYSVSLISLFCHTCNINWCYDCLPYAGKIRPCLTDVISAVRQITKSVEFDSVSLPLHFVYFDINHTTRAIPKDALSSLLF